MPAKRLNALECHRAPLSCHFPFPRLDPPLDASRSTRMLAANGHVVLSNGDFCYLVGHHFADPRGSETTDRPRCPHRAGPQSKMGGMTELAPSLVELARRFGIATEYDDWTGRRVLVSEATLVAVLVRPRRGGRHRTRAQRGPDRATAVALGTSDAGDHRRAVPVRRRGSGCT